MQVAVSLGFQQRNITEQSSCECKPAASRMYELSTWTYSAARISTATNQTGKKKKLDQTAALCRCQNITPKQRGTSSYTVQKPDTLRTAEGEKPSFATSRREKRFCWVMLPIAGLHLLCVHMVCSCEHSWNHWPSIPQIGSGWKTAVSPLL